MHDYRPPLGDIRLVLDEISDISAICDLPPFEHVDVETIDGLVAFSEAECINPSRIPAMLVCRYDEAFEEYVPLSNARPGANDPVSKKSKLYQYLGLQTDYSDVGKGIISPKMIKSVLAEAGQ